MRSRAVTGRLSSSDWVMLPKMDAADALDNGLRAKLAW
jgi:hypothetical protein